MATVPRKAKNGDASEIDCGERSNAGGLARMINERK